MKNIVLLSDGTGNSAAKRHRTNVWRLYRALDLHRPDQIAFYDDGVGSQEFLPLKIVGGAIGYGLRRNIIELYKFLCRNYEPGDANSPADKIYLFGFSRGAFTVRVLAGMIDYCGLYKDFKDEADLNKKARHNYSAFRSSFKHGLLSRAYRFLTRKSDQPIETTVKPGIEFIGVWDTVDAYGLPADELAILWDRFIFPIRFPDCRLSQKVKRACHALAIDDERHTFHPVLWDESKETTDRIEQVWFAGVHSDVGGGYPKNDLSLVTLDWMMSRVGASTSKDPGLHFISPMSQEIQSHCDWHGVQHDSRSGLGAYYRYKPRNIGDLCNDKYNGVEVSKPKIHRGVLERIKCNVIAYAPTGLPKSYDVVVTRGQQSPPYENAGQGSGTQSTDRKKAMNYALDAIYWRQWLYGALLFTTLALLVSRFFLPWTPGGICKGSACAIDPVMKLMIRTLPDFASGWFEALRQNPAWLLGFTATFTVLLTLKSMAWKKTLLLSTKAWSELKGKGSPPVWVPTLTSKLRELMKSKLQWVVKWGASILVFGLIVALLIVLIARTSFYVRSTMGFLCESTNTTVLDKSKTRSVSLDISNPCYATGLKLEEGKTYRFDVKVIGDEWTDGPDYSTDPNGFTSVALMPFTPLRRTLSEPWLKLMGQIDDVGKEYLVIGSGLKEYKAKSSGELFLYVNDAAFGVFPDPYWAWPYFWATGRNNGTATITVTELENTD